VQRPERAGHPQKAVRTNFGACVGPARAQHRRVIGGWCARRPGIGTSATPRAVNCAINGLCQVIEGGGTAHEVMALSGHRTLAMVQKYTEEVNQTALADGATAKRTNRGVHPSVRTVHPAKKA